MSYKLLLNWKLHLNSSALVSAYLHGKTVYDLYIYVCMKENSVVAGSIYKYWIYFYNLIF